MDLGHVRDWHSPRNTDCPHNTDVVADCACKLHIKGSGKRKTKARVIFRCTDRGVERGIKPDLVVELHDNGELLIREAGRRAGSALGTTVGEIYARLLMNESRRIVNEKRAARAAKRKRKGGKR